MVGLQTLDLAIGVRVPASQPTYSDSTTVTMNLHPIHFSQSAQLKEDER